MTADSVVKDWYLIRWWDQELLIGMTLYGTVVKCKKGGFPEGVEAKSSPIDEEIDEPHYAIPYFNSGVKPPYTGLIQMSKELENEGFTVEESVVQEPKIKH